ncbi:MAG: hypothetical protein NTZ34_08860, partial [Chloroflexi bacterium]|nr:hypothetical protein [Chloroflexota bacterium]
MENTSKPMQGRRDKLEVIIYTQTHKIVGTVHTMPASRLVDFMNSKVVELFIVVTGASVYTLPEEKLLQTADFLALNKKGIMMVLPKPPGTPIIADVQSKDTAH